MDIADGKLKYNMMLSVAENIQKRRSINLTIRINIRTFRKFFSVYNLFKGFGVTVNV